MTLTAGASAHILIDRLEKAGWGSLAGPEFRGVRYTLAALTRHLDPRTAQGKATVYQIAERTGYGERWTRRCLQILEELDLIEWDRGGIVDGQPTPSWLRVSKQALLLLLGIARKTATERLAEHQAITRARIAHYRLTRTRKRRRHHQKRRSLHAAPTAALLSIEEVPDRPGPTGPGPETPRATATATIALIQAQIREQLRTSRGPQPTPVPPRKAAATRRSA